jgi:uncharacterized iron-regulated membrane protein
MTTLRRVLFWCHLTGGALAGLVILLLCVTGIVLAFQPQILRLVERSARTAPSPSGQHLPAGRLLLRTAELSRGFGPRAVTVSADPSEAATVSFGQERIFFLDPENGTVLGEGSRRLRTFFARVQDLHRWLLLPEENRAAGKAATGAANLVFLGLGLTGLYIWWPRLRGIRRVSSVGLFQRGLSGKARDFNWHNVVGAWCAVPILVITTTGMVISYRWAGDLVYRLTGNAPSPAPAQGNRGRGGRGELSPLTAERAAALDRLWSIAERQSPGWRAITLRLPESGRGPVSFSIEEGSFRNRFARSALTLDPESGAVVKWEPYAQANAGRQARSWMRFLHTGEALGLPGQIVAALACAGGILLAVTGLSLALRRFESRRVRRAGPASITPLPEIPVRGDEDDLSAPKGATG